MGYSSADITRLRHPHHASRVVLNAVPRVVVASAQINQTAFTYPLAALTVHNTSTNWLTESLVGRMVTIGTAPGLDDVTTGIIRKAVTADTLYLDAKGLGDSGYARDIRQPIQHGHYVTVYKWRPAWGVYSSIRGGVFYKAFDQPYVDEGLKPAPVVRMGAHRAAPVNPNTGLATLTFDASASTAWGGDAITAYAWNVDGGTIVSGAGTSSIIATFPAGFYEVRCTVTAANGKSRTGYRYVWANAATGQWVAFSDRYRVGIDSDTQDRHGRQMTLTFPETISDELFPGQGFLLSEYPTFGGESLDGTLVSASFFGYAADLEIARHRRGQTITLNIGGPLHMAASVPTASQYMEEIPYPRNWTQVTRALSNPPGAAWYAAAYHAPYLVDGHDMLFDAALLSLRRKIYTLQNKTLQAQLDDIGKLVSGVVGARSDGAIRIVPHACYLTTAQRNALAERWTWGAGDIADISQALAYRPGIGTVNGYAFAYTGMGEGIPLASRAPGWIQGQGSGEDSLTVTVAAADGQTELNRITGHHYAYVNRRVGNFTLNVVGNRDVAEPCDVDVWHRFQVAAAYDPLNVGWNTRILPVRVTRQWEPVNQKSLRVEFEVETFGHPGVTVPVNRGGADTYMTNQWNPANSDPWEDKEPDFPPDIQNAIGVVFACNEAGALGRTNTFTDRLVTWERMSAFGRPVLDISMDRHSDYFSDPATGDLGLWVLEWENVENNVGETTLALWYIPDANRRSYTPVLSNSWQIKENMYGHARVIASDTEAGFVAVAWKDRTGVRVARSTNNGTSWTTAYVGGSVSDLDSVREDLAIDLQGQHIVVIAPDGTQNLDGTYNHYLYHSSSKIGAFSKISNPGAFIPAHGALAIGASTVALVPLVNPAPPAPVTAISNVTFDDGTYDVPGYTSYVVSGSGDNSGTAKYITMPSVMAYSNRLYNNANVQKEVAVSVVVDLGADYYLDNVAFDAAQFIGVTRTGLSGWVRVQALDSSGSTLASWGDLTANQTSSTAIEHFAVTAAQLHLTTQSVRQIRVQHHQAWDSSSGTGDIAVLLDNIDIRGTLVPYTTQRSIFTLQLATGVYEQRNTYERLPRFTYSLAVNRANNAQVTAIVIDEAETAPVRLTTGTTGASWAFGGTMSGYTGARRSGDALIAWGYDRLGLSPDNGATIYNRMGNWRAACGMAGRFLAVTGVL